MNEMNVRECKQCRQVKDLNPETFPIDEPRGKDGYRVTLHTLPDSEEEGAV